MLVVRVSTVGTFSIILVLVGSGIAIIYIVQKDILSASLRIWWPAVPRVMTPQSMTRNTGPAGVETRFKDGFNEQLGRTDEHRA